MLAWTIYLSFIGGEVVVAVSAGDGGVPVLDATTCRDRPAGVTIEGKA